MKLRSPRPARPIRFAVIALVAVGLTIGVVYMVARRISPQSTVQTIALATKPADESFPTVDSRGLSPLRQSILRIAAEQYAKQPAGTTYSQGAKEPWCANFVSWVMQQAGAPLANPHTGGWRIPGVYTLREYYQSQSRWRTYKSGYTPRPGDVVIYDGGIHGQHTHFVVSYQGGVLTTVGGNEGGKIRIQHHKLTDELAVVGYGIAD